MNETRGTPTAVWVLGIVAIAIGLARSNPVVVVASSLYLGMAAVAEVWVRLGLKELTYSRRLSARRVFPGEDVRVEFVVENRKRLPRPWVVVEDEFPEALSITGVPVGAHYLPRRVRVVNLFSLRWWQRARRVATITPPARGVYRLGPTRLACGDPLGLAQSERTMEGKAAGDDLLIVYPEVRSATGKEAQPRSLPSGRRARQKANLADPSEFLGLREYVPGDPFKHIDWKSTARTGRLHTRVLSPMPSGRSWVVVNLATTEAAFFRTDAVLAEAIISASGSLALDLLAKGHQVGVLANSFAKEWGLYLKVPLSASPAQAALILEGLARLDIFPTMRLAEVLRRELSPGQMDCHLWLVSPKASPALEDAIDYARVSGYSTSLVTVERGEEQADACTDENPRTAYTHH
ncbi:MAG: DUF58 domain-containing protein [Bacillota bacterium]